MKRALFLFCLLTFGASSCGGPAQEQEQGPLTRTTDTEEGGERPREAPPPSGPARDVQFPSITRAQTGSGLELNTVQFGHLPLVYVRLVIKSGDATSPADHPGLAHFVAQMLKEGTRRRSSAQLAEDVEFLGADLSVGSDEESVTIMIAALREHVDQAMTILADVAMNPAFSQTELSRLKRRELDRLALSSQQPRYLARRAFYREIYGNHPYANVDTTPDAVNRMTRSDLSNWHRTYVVPNNAFLVAVGDITPDAVQQSAERAFRGWRSRTVPPTQYAAPPERTSRNVIVVDRPQSVQSVIYVGNLALRRTDPKFIPLTVANQVLGGSAASRLFMDLREQRSLTYGAYSGITERQEIAPFIAYAAVRNEVTADAMAGFMEHLDRIVAQAAPESELNDAKRFLSDSFPLEIETAARIASMVEFLRVYSLADDYWDGYRTSIRAVSTEEAHQAAREYIHPERALIVAVGKAADIVEPLRRYGPVRVVDNNGNEVASFPAVEAAGTARQ